MSDLEGKNVTLGVSLSAVAHERLIASSAAMGMSNEDFVRKAIGVLSTIVDFVVDLALDTGRDIDDLKARLTIQGGISDIKGAESTGFRAFPTFNLPPEGQNNG